MERRKEGSQLPTKENATIAIEDHVIKNVWNDGVPLNWTNHKGRGTQTSSDGKLTVPAC